MVESSVDTVSIDPEVSIDMDPTSVGAAAGWSPPNGTPVARLSTVTLWRVTGVAWLLGCIGVIVAAGSVGHDPRRIGLPDGTEVDRELVESTLRTDAATRRRAAAQKQRWSAARKRVAEALGRLPTWSEASPVGPPSGHIRRTAVARDISIERLRIGDEQTRESGRRSPMTIGVRGRYGPVIRWLDDLGRSPPIDIESVELFDAAGDGWLRVELTVAACDRGGDPRVRRWIDELNGSPPDADRTVVARKPRAAGVPNRNGITR